MSMNPIVLNHLTNIATDFAKEANVMDEVIHGVRHHIRHTLKINFDRNEREILNSIVWWSNRFIDYFIKDKLSEKDIKELKRCYYIIHKRLNELKRLDDKNHNYNENRYKPYYEELQLMRNRLAQRNIRTQF